MLAQMPEMFEKQLPVRTLNKTPLLPSELFVYRFCSLVAGCVDPDCDCCLSDDDFLSLTECDALGGVFRPGSCAFALPDDECGAVRDPGDGQRMGECEDARMLLYYWVFDAVIELVMPLFFTLVTSGTFSQERIVLSSSTTVA